MENTLKFDLENRLLDFATTILRIVDRMDKTSPGMHIGDHLMRAGTSPLFNQGEAQSAESTKDFVHKMSICLKELRETRRALLLVRKVPLIRDVAPIEPALQETEQLIRIFYTSIRTAKSNALRECGTDYLADDSSVPLD